MIVEGLSKMVDEKTTMKKITLSLTDKTEEALRKMTEEKYGGMKGALSMIVENALQEYFKRINEGR